MAYESKAELPRAYLVAIMTHARLLIEYYRARFENESNEFVEFTTWEIKQSLKSLLPNVEFQKYTGITDSWATVTHMAPDGVYSVFDGNTIEDSHSEEEVYLFDFCGRFSEPNPIQDKPLGPVTERVVALQYRTALECAIRISLRRMGSLGDSYPEVSHSRYRPGTVPQTREEFEQIMNVLAAHDPDTGDIQSVATFWNEWKARHRVDARRVVELGAISAADAPSSQTTPTEFTAVFRQNGIGGFDIQFGDERVLTPNLLGARVVYELVRKPAKFFDAGELKGLVSPPSSIDVAQRLHDQEGLETTDRKTISDVKRRAAELGNLIQDAREERNKKQQTKLLEELEQINDYLSSVRDITGKPRKTGGGKSKARNALSKNLNSFKKRCSDEAPSFAAHLDVHIRVQNSGFIYIPDPSVEWTH